ncbi:MAG: hypothetical protein JWP89_3535 [Schlesneria sp.]|nr:hypothetical protein [Schlesneria sp.]
MPAIHNGKLSHRYLTSAILLYAFSTVTTGVWGQVTKPDKKYACRFDFVKILEEGDAGYREGFQSFKLRLGSGDWEGAKVMESSAWGGGKDLWGWNGGADVAHSEVAKDQTGYFFIYSLKADGASKWIAANFRYELADGSKGVGQALFPYSKEADEADSRLAETSKSAAVTLKLRATLKGHPALVYNVQFTSDGKTLVSSSFRGSKQNKQDSYTIIAWSVADAGKSRVFIPADQSITCFGISAAGKQAAVGKNDYVATYDLKTSKEVGKLPGPGMVSPLCVAATEKGTVIAAGLQNYDIVLWDTKTRKATRTLKGHSGAVISLAFSPDGTQLVSGGTDNAARLWDVASGKGLHVLKPEGVDSPVAVVRYSHDGSTLATCANTVHFWNPKTGEAKQVLPPEELYGSRAFAFSPDGKLGASTSINLEDYKQGKITIWDLGTKKKSVEVIDADGLVYDLTFSPDSKQLASGGGETVKLWTIVQDETP